jgi:DNA-binding NarL/FixJ family response regulator
MTVRVLIADDQILVRTGLRMILSADPGIEVVGEAATGLEAVALTERLGPDVVLMDVQMPGVDGIEATRRIVAGPRSAEVKVVMLTTFDLDEYVYDALVAGASGFLLKEIPAEHLVEGILRTHEGDALLAPSVARRLIAEYTATRRLPTITGMDQLSNREHEVLLLLATGMSNREIAHRLFVGESTVKTHVARVLAKLQVRDRVQAVIVAYDAGLVRPPGPS